MTPTRFGSGGSIGASAAQFGESSSPGNSAHGSGQTITSHSVSAPPRLLPIEDEDLRRPRRREASRLGELTRETDSQEKGKPTPDSIGRRNERLRRDIEKAAESKVQEMEQQISNLEAAAKRRNDEVELRCELLERRNQEFEQEDHGSDLGIRGLETVRKENAARLLSKDQDMALLSDKYKAGRLDGIVRMKLER